MLNYLENFNDEYIVSEFHVEMFTRFQFFTLPASNVVTPFWRTTRSRISTSTRSVNTR